VSDLIVKVEDVRLTYMVKHALSSSLKQAFINAVKRKSSSITVDAVKNVNFELVGGEVLGIIGKNGAGKSSLLKLLAGILPPTSGSIEIKGRIAPLIELSAGFNPELTGRENIVLFGVLLGKSKKLMEDEVDNISSWAGLSEFIDFPIRTYSTGMQARLGFAVATFQPTELLIVDEVLSVGDSNFQLKSLERIEKLISEGEATILVSHDLQLIEQKATKVLWLENGNQKMIGDPQEVVNAYKKS
jgi:ABC-2 type transport system ATP-binding protein